MPTDELKKLLLEALPPGNQALASMLSSLLDMPGGTTADVPTVVPAQTSQLEPVSHVEAEASSQAAVTAKTTSQTGGGGKSEESPISKALSAISGSVFSAFPLFSGIASLFGGNEPAPPTPPSRYVPPPAIHYEGAVSSSNPEVIYGVSYGANAMPRASGRVPDFPSVPAGLPASWQAGLPAPQINPQITIQVQAMDSRSFLDHSEEIARAVKEAILNSNSLNDVFSEL